MIQKCYSRVDFCRLITMVIIAFQQKGRHGLRELGSNCAVPPFDSVSATNPATTGRPAQQKNNPKTLARIRGGDGETWCESWG